MREVVDKTHPVSRQVGAVTAFVAFVVALALLVLAAKLAMGHDYSSPSGGGDDLFLKNLDLRAAFVLALVAWLMVGVGSWAGSIAGYWDAKVGGRLFVWPLAFAVLGVVVLELARSIL